MKSLVAVSLISLGLFTATSASAQIDCRRGVDHKNSICYSGYNPGYYRHHNPVIVQRNNDWVAPVLGAVIIGAAINEINRQRSQPIIVQPPMYAPQYPENSCSEWREILNPDGSISRERFCRPNY